MVISLCRHVYVIEHIVVVLLDTMYLKISPCFCSLSTGWYYCSIYSLYQGHLYKDFKCYIAMFLKNIIWWAIMISSELQAKLHLDKLELYTSFTITYNAVSIYSAMLPGKFHLVTEWKWWIMCWNHIWKIYHNAHKIHLRQVD